MGDTERKRFGLSKVLPATIMQSASEVDNQKESHCRYGREAVLCLTNGNE